MKKENKKLGELLLEAGAPDETVTESVPEAKLEQEASRPKGDLSQKVVIESLIELLVSKGIITREELIKRIKSRSRS